MDQSRDLANPKLSVRFFRHSILHLFLTSKFFVYPSPLSLAFDFPHAVALLLLVDMNNGPDPPIDHVNLSLCLSRTLSIPLHLPQPTHS